MKILKYRKGKGNEYKIITDKDEYKLYDDIIIKYELLLKKDIDDKDFTKILEENKLFSAYYDALKLINTKLRTEKEIKVLLKKKEYNYKEIDYAIKRLDKEGYLNHKVYIEAFIHDMLNLYLIGEDKILKDLVNLGFEEKEIRLYLDKIDKDIYKDKIDKYINKKLKANKKSEIEFKRKFLGELINKGFSKNDIMIFLENTNVVEDEEVTRRLIIKLYNKYIKKYDYNTVKLKIRNYLYQKGYKDIDIDKYIK